MATQQPFQPRAPLGHTPTNNPYHIRPTPDSEEPNVSLGQLPVKNNAGLIAGLGLALTAILGLLLYYGL